MTSTNYNRGRIIEYKIIKELTEEGYLTGRTAGSHGLFDIFAIKDNEIIFIQAKRIKKGKSAQKDSNLKAFKELKLIPGAKKQLWTWIDRKGFIKEDL